VAVYKCENPECGNVFQSNNPLSCPKCDTLEFSTIHIKSNKKLLVFGLLILLIGAGLVYLNNDESSNTESERTELKIETIKFTGGLMYSTTSLNVRIKPNKNSEKVTSLKLNTPVLTNTKDIGGWVLISDTDSNKLGYVHSSYLSKEIVRPKKVSSNNSITYTSYNEIKIGQKLYGGIIFYIDESGKHGLVAAMEDLTEGAVNNGNDMYGYRWGCFQESVNGAEGTSIGTGYQNTIDIVNQGCTPENGALTAAQAALAYESNGYDDWFIPSKDELLKMYNTIGSVGPEGNIGRFSNDLYWSSSEYNNNFAWYVNFGNGYTYSNFKYYASRVRIIRAF
jgi:uncharacterized protein YgiM (DUF1202 family)